MIAARVLAYGSNYKSTIQTKEGNNLFGIRTWDPLVPQMKAKKRPNAEWGVRMYDTYCTCIVDYIQILNNHPAYEEFRQQRSLELKLKQYIDGEFEQVEIDSIKMVHESFAILKRMIHGILEF